MTASPTEVKLILDAIKAVREDVHKLRAELGAETDKLQAHIKQEIDGVSDGVNRMDRRINGRIRRLEQFRWQLVGAAAALSMAAGIILRLV